MTCSTDDSAAPQTIPPRHRRFRRAKVVGGGTVLGAITDEQLLLPEGNSGVFYIGQSDMLLQRLPGHIDRPRARTGEWVRFSGVR